jgi:hypothetical protein
MAVHAGVCQVLILSAALAARATAANAPAPASSQPVVADNFDNLDHWVAEGPFQPERIDGRMRLQTDARRIGQYVWCKQELPADFRVEFDMTPASDSGFFLVFFCTQGTRGEDILGDDLFKDYMPARDWKEYEDFDKYVSPVERKTHQSRIRGYHISYRRNELANCNLRKNPGLQLLKSSDLKTLLPKGKTAHVVLTKQAGHIRLQVNGEAFMDYTDEKDPHSGGRFGFRQVYEAGDRSSA